MSLQGILLLDLVGLILIGLILNLVRIRKLHVAFAVIWLLALMAMITIISIPPLLNFVTQVVGATFPASAMTLLALLLVFVMLIFFSMQLSIISARQIEMAQKMALLELLAREKEREIDKVEPGEEAAHLPAD
jgi:hypothetical protein